MPPKKPDISHLVAVRRGNLQLETELVHLLTLQLVESMLYAFKTCRRKVLSMLTLQGGMH